MPLRRSITFWSGILVMGFLLWANWDSRHYITFGGYYLAPDKLLKFTNDSGQLYFALDRGSGINKSSYAERDREEQNYTRDLTSPLALPQFYSGPTYIYWAPGEMKEIENVTRWQVLLSHSFLFLSCLLLWLGLLLWRARRIRRARQPGNTDS